MTDTISIPPLRDLPSEHLEARKQLLLSEIAREPDRPRLALPTIPVFKRPRSRSVFVVAVIVAALTGAGMAIAAGFGAFDGISAAEHPRGTADVLEPAVVAGINKTNDTFTLGPTGKLLPDSARFTRQLPSGERVFALTTTTDKLCVLILGRPGSNMTYAIGCGDPLNQNHPTTIEGIRPDPKLPALTFGVAIDGITSVSGVIGGTEVTVPVENNVWAYEGASAALQSLTVHYTDGATQTFTPDGRWQPATSP